MWITHLAAHIGPIAIRSVQLNLGRMMRTKVLLHSLCYRILALYYLFWGSVRGNEQTVLHDTIPLGA